MERSSCSINNVYRVGISFRVLLSTTRSDKILKSRLWSSISWVLLTDFVSIVTVPLKPNERVRPDSVGVMCRLYESGLVVSGKVRSVVFEDQGEARYRFCQDDSGSSVSSRGTPLPLDGAKTYQITMKRILRAIIAICASHPHYVALI